MAVTPDEQLDDAPLRCAYCGAEAQSAAGLASHVRSRHAPDDAPATVAEAAAIDGDGKSGKGLLARLWSKREPKPDAAAKPKAPAKRRGRRVSGVDILSMPFDHGARVLDAWKPCTARVVAWEATWGAYVLDEALAGTLPDRLLVQPLARNYKRVAMIESVLGPVALAFAMESRPSLIPHLMPEMHRAIRGAAPYMLKAVAAKRVEDEQIEAAFREAYPTAPPDKTADEMIDDLLADVFAPLAARIQQEDVDAPVAA